MNGGTKGGHVAVAIVGFRNAGDIAECLHALAASTHSDFSVYICENGGDEAYARLLDSTPAQLPGGQPVFRINAGENLGYAGGVNRAIRAAADSGYRAVWVLNPDTEPRPGALAALLVRLDRGDADAVGGVVLWSDDVVQTYGGVWRFRFGVSASLGMLARADAPVDPTDIEARQDFLCGASMLVSRRLIEQIGLMKEDYFLYCEEVEWCLRAQRMGFRLGFTPDARVIHKRGTTTGWTGKRGGWPRLAIYLDARNRMHLTREVAPQNFATAVAFTLVQAVWRYGRRGGLRPIIYTFEGVFAALRGEMGRPAWVP